MPYERFIDFEIARDVTVRFSQSGRPIDRYSVVLLTLVDDAEETVRVYDNHGGSHHMHRYTRSEGKQAPEEFHPGPTKQAIPAAIEHLKAHWKAIIQSWAS